MSILLNIFLSASLISLALWVAKTNPVLGGFIVSLPLSTLIVLALNKLQNPDAASGAILAKSILVGIPATLLFFVPFLLADRMKISFWQAYGSGFVLLGLSFFIHRYLVTAFFK
jgi:hypothetical protein